MIVEGTIENARECVADIQLFYSMAINRLRAITKINSLSMAK